MFQLYQTILLDSVSISPVHIGLYNAAPQHNLHIRGVATATTFWLSMGYNFGCIIASDTLLPELNK